jgi:sugar phosphate isomerase/epimerase
MPTRRAVLSTFATGIGALALRPLQAAGLKQDIASPLSGPIGLQLWSLRAQLPKDLPGTLAKVRAMGFREVEAAGLYKHTLAEFRAALDHAGLRCQSAHAGFGELRDATPSAFEQAKGFGATWVVCPWIDHKDDTFTREDALKAAEVFNRVGKAAEDAGLKFAYHCHGYEFVPSTEGTLFDTLAGATDPARVAFQIDVLHAYLGGADPAALITTYAPRVKSLHLKDLVKGFVVKAGTAIAPASSDVPVGTGQVDMKAALAAAVKAGVPLFYVEDESPDPLGHIPESLKYLQGVKL